MLYHCPLNWQYRVKKGLKNFPLSEKEREVSELLKFANNSKKNDMLKNEIFRKSSCVLLFLFIIKSTILCAYPPFSLESSGESSKIEPALIQDLIYRDKSEKIRINIILKSQYDQSELRKKTTSFKNREEKRKFVVNELKNFSKETQQELISFLTDLSTKSEVTEIVSFWISNSINCYATCEIIEKIALHPDVLLIGWDNEINMISTPTTQRGDLESGINDNELFKSNASHPPSEGTRGRLEHEITYNITKVQADEVWEMGYTGEGVIVAILDTGVNYYHSDLVGNMWENEAYPFHGWNFFNNNENPMDDHGHGTHVAGTVAGQGASGVQTGIAPQATIMAVKTHNSSGTSSMSIIVNGFEFAVENGAHIINCSFSASGGGSASHRVLLRNAMINILETGIIASVAAGNDGAFDLMYPIPNNIGLPGNCPPPWIHPHQTLAGGESAVVCVGSINENDQIAVTSSRGPVTWQNIPDFNDYPYNPGMGLIRPDVVAPGVDIKSLSHLGYDSYVTMSGTSMATPCVAGVMALMLSKNLNLTPAKICEILETTAYPLTATKSNVYGSGRVNALNAVNAVNEPINIVFESLIINDEEGNNNGRLNPGETVFLTISLKNEGNSEVENVNAKIETTSDLVVINQDFAFFGTIGVLETATVANKFSITLSEEAYARQETGFSLIISSGLSTCHSEFKIIVYDYCIEIEAVTIPKNEPLSPGETSDLLIYLKNSGNENAYELNGNISTTSSFLIINENVSYYGTLYPEQYKQRTYIITVAPNTPSALTGFNFTMKITVDSERTTIVNSFINIKNSDSPPPTCAGIENLSAENISSNVIISWEATDGNAPEKYLIYCNNKLLTETVSTTYIHENIEIENYNYCVEAYYSNGCTSDLYCIDLNVHISDNKIPSPIITYPNPFTNEIIVSNPELIKSIQITTVIGQKVKEEMITDKPISTEFLAKGIYFVTIESVSGDKVVHKMIKK